MVLNFVRREASRLSSNSAMDDSIGDPDGVAGLRAQ